MIELIVRIEMPGEVKRVLPFTGHDITECKRYLSEYLERYTEPGTKTHLVDVRPVALGSSIRTNN